LQRQLHASAGVTVDGFDLCLPALQLNEADTGTLYYYNIFDRAPQFESRYDVIFLFDVLEHVEDDVGFLKTCLFYLKPGGRLIVNVPARMELFSKYDCMAGHVRRYTLRTLRQCAISSDLNIEAMTYWGLPFYPILFLRKFVLAIRKDRSSFDVGFAPPGELANQALGLLSKLEFIPQRFLGTSILSVFHKCV
jgi:SAM-dependent methyltransferase